MRANDPSKPPVPVQDDRAPVPRSPWRRRALRLIEVDGAPVRSPWRRRALRTVLVMTVATLLLILLLRAAGMLPNPFPCVAVAHSTPICGQTNMPASAPDEQQVFRMSLSDFHLNPLELDPALAETSAALNVLPLIFPGLVTLNDHLRPTPWAAWRWDVSQDGTVYSFSLRPGMWFSTGEPLTAATFAFALNRIVDPCTRSPLAGFLLLLRDAPIFHDEVCGAAGTHLAAPEQTAPVLQSLLGDAIEVPDASTLVLHLTHPASSFLASLTYPGLGAIPVSLVQTYRARWPTHLADGAGTGGSLFKVVGGDGKRLLLLERNERFWGTKPRLRQLMLTFGAVPDDLAPTLASVPVAVTFSVSPETLRHPQPHLQYAQVKALGLLNYMPDWRQAPFDDARMRQAFALALDKAAIVAQVINRKFAIATNHLVPEGMPGYNPDLRAPDGMRSLTGNPQQAAALAMQYAQERCAGQLSACPPVRVVVPLSFLAEANASLAMWQRALPGYPITVAVVNDFGSQLRDPGQLKAIGVSADYPDPQDLLSLAFEPDAPFNLGHVDLLEATRLLQIADADLDAARRLTEYQQAEQLLVTQVALIPIEQKQFGYAVRDDVVNFQETPVLETTLDVWARVYIAQSQVHASPIAA